MKRFYLAAILLHLAVLFWVNPTSGQTSPKKENPYVEITLTSESGPSEQPRPVDTTGPNLAVSPLLPIPVIAPEALPPPPIPEPLLLARIPPPPEISPPPTPSAVEVAPAPPPPTPEVTPSPAPVAEPSPTTSDVPVIDSTSADSVSAVSALSEGDSASGGGNSDAQPGTGQGGGGGTRVWAKMISDHDLLWPDSAEYQRIVSVLRAEPNPTLVNGYLSGVVTIRIRITRQGTVAQPTVIKSSGFPLLDEAGIKSVQRFKFTPEQLNGTPVPEIRTYVLQYEFAAPHAPPSPAAHIRH